MMRFDVMARLRALAKSYSLDMVDVADGDVVVDVGANIGEIGMYYALVRGGGGELFRPRTDGQRGLVLPVEQPRKNGVAAGAVERKRPCSILRIHRQ